MVITPIDPLCGKKLGFLPKWQSPLLSADVLAKEALEDSVGSLPAGLHGLVRQLDPPGDFAIGKPFPISHYDDLAVLAVERQQRILEGVDQLIAPVLSPGCDTIDQADLG